MKRILSIVLILVLIFSTGATISAQSVWTPLEPEDFFDGVWENYASAAETVMEAYPGEILPAFHPSRDFEILDDGNIAFQMGVVADIMYTRAEGASVIISGAKRANDVLAEIVIVLVQTLFDMDFVEAANFMIDNVDYLLDNNTRIYTADDIIMAFESNSDGSFVLLIGRLPVEVY